MTRIWHVIGLCLDTSCGPHPPSSRLPSSHLEGRGARARRKVERPAGRTIWPWPLLCWDSPGTWQTGRSGSHPPRTGPPPQATRGVQAGVRTRVQRGACCSACGHHGQATNPINDPLYRSNPMPIGVLLTCPPWMLSVGRRVGLPRGY